MRTPAQYKDGYMARANNLPIEACPRGFTTIGSDGRLITVSPAKRIELEHWWKAGWNDKDRKF